MLSLTIVLFFTSLIGGFIAGLVTAPRKRRPPRQPSAFGKGAIAGLIVGIIAAPVTLIRTVLKLNK